MKKGKRKGGAKVEGSTGGNAKAIKGDPIDIIRKVKNLASAVGGMSKLKPLVEALAE